MASHSPGCSSQTHLPGLTPLPAPNYPSFPELHLPRPGDPPQETLQRKKRQRSAVSSLENSPQISDSTTLLTPHLLLAALAFLCEQQSSHCNTSQPREYCKKSVARRKIHPFPKAREKSESLATHSFNILVDHVPWTWRIFHFLFVLFPAISKACMKSIKT